MKCIEYPIDSGNTWKENFRNVSITRFSKYSRTKMKFIKKH